MNCLPNEITLSTKATHKFSYVKQKVGITPNIMARVAIFKALESDIAPELLETPESLGQKIPKDIAFGEYGDIFNFAIKQYIDTHSYSGDVKILISNLIETGAYKIGNIKKPQDLECLF
ncbi:DndE family protein [bacterium]|nr:DndE family protein [bacterium]